MRCYTPFRYRRRPPGQESELGEAEYGYFQRRVFYGKVGAADQLVELLKEGDRALQSYGTSLKSRVLTDYMSGRSDRVVVEWEVEDLASIETAMNAAMAGSGGQEFFTEWADRLNQLIHYAEVESWTVR